MEIDPSLPKKTVPSRGLPMSQPSFDETFVDRITSAQQALFAYILVLLPNIADASDVLQETNLVLWRKRDEFRTELDFLPWAKAIARFQVLAILKQQHRRRLRFSDTLLSQLAEEPAARETPELESEHVALGDCIDELAPPNQELLRLRYSTDLTLQQIAQQSNRSEGAVRGALYRIRGELADCIRHKMRSKEGEQ